jgi:Arc/MetJ-type ribon-helix-helix transcriptional regulator
MNISISDQTQRLLEDRMKKGGFRSPDEALRIALETMEEVEGVSIEELDPETQAAIERAEAEADRGEGRPWEEVREELRALYLKP